MDITQAFQALNPNLHWLDRYLAHLDNAPEPAGAGDRHHILPKALFPQFTSLRKHPWNCAFLQPADHLLAHYYLYRALPGNQLIRYAFRLMVGKHYLDLVEQQFDEALVQEVAHEYEKVRLGRENVPSTQGWVHLYRGDEEHTAVPQDSVEDYIQDGWTTTPHPRPWMTNGIEDRRVKVKEVQSYLDRGYTLGRSLQHSVDTRALMSDIRVKAHAAYKASGGDYAFMPRGDSHPRRITGISEETKRKISEGLTGKKQTPEHIENRRQKLIGQKKPWKLEKRLLRSLQMKGIRPAMSRTGTTHTEDSKRKMSEAHLRFYQEDPTRVAALDAARPRGASHWTYGQPRDESTRSKISQSLTGKTASEDTKAKMSETRARKAYDAITPEEHAILEQALTHPNRLSLRAGLKASDRLYVLLTGLNTIFEGKATPETIRYWGPADRWLQFTGREHLRPRLL